MSLVCWLPLDGNLNQQGTSSIEVTGTNLTLNTSGKIGSCYSFNGSNSYIMLSEAPFSNSMIEFSYTCWVKFTSLSSGCLFSNRTATQYTGITIFVNNSGNILFDAGNERRTKSYTFTTNIWYHLAFTYKKGDKKKIYINGIEIDSITSTGSTTAASATNAFIGASQNSSTTVNANYLNGQLNDIRIYDHCLSPAEVHEISQGLVLHYKLDQVVQPNLLTGNINLVGQWVSDGITRTQDGDAIKCVYTNAGGNRRIYNGVSGVWTPVNSHFIISFDAKASTNGVSIDCSRSNGNGTDKVLFTLTSNWAHYSGKIINTAAADGGTLSIRCNTNDSTFWIKNIKLERGDVESAFILPGYSNNTIYDSSGYGHNGTIVGTPTITSNTARHSASTYLADGTTSRITTPQLSFEPHAITLNIWFKSTNTSPTGTYHMVVDSNANRQWYEMAVHQTGYFRGGLFINDARKADNGTSTKCLDGKWHMLTLSYDGTNVNRYVDGIMEKATTAAFSTGLSTPTALTIGRDGPSASYAVKEASISDFRIYCTALSAADVKQLYEVGAKVDNNNNIHTFELDETISKINNQNVTFSNTNSSSNSIIKSYSTASTPAPNMTTNQILSPSQLTETSLIPIQLGDEYSISINECIIRTYTYSYQSSYWGRTGPSTYQRQTNPRYYGQYAREYIYIEYYNEEQNLLGQKFVKNTIKSPESTTNQGSTLEQFPAVNCIISLPDTNFPEFSSAKYVKICIQKDGSTITDGIVTSIAKGISPKIKLFKNGVLQTRQFIENTQAKFYPLSSIEGNNLIEL